MNTLRSDQPFKTEGGFVFDHLDIAYDTWGTLNEQADNVIWVCHAMTANSDVKAWWPGMVGDNLAFDTRKSFIVCANILASCYGTTGPASINPETGKEWLGQFPVVTIRDLVNVHEVLRKHLGIKKIHSVIGASIGGDQALEYSIMYPNVVTGLVFIAASARQSPWAIAFNESQRLAIESDSTFMANGRPGGLQGLKAARSIALLSYRTPHAYNKTQSEESDDKLDSYRASSYQAYQGDKLVKRFNAWSYYRLTQLADSHNVGRDRGGIIKALKSVRAKTLCIGIRSDILYPLDEQKFVASNITGAQYAEIDSFYGHDGFLIEVDQVTEILKKFWE